MSERFPGLTSRQVETVLQSHKFELIGQKGSHRKWWNAERRVTVIVPSHAGKALPIGTLRQIARSSGIPNREWRA